MKTTIKHNLIIFHRPREWDELQQRLIKEYGQSVILIRDKCRRELGFTPRHHKGLIPYLDKWGHGVVRNSGATKEQADRFIAENKHKMAYDDQVHLDFYSESAMSWFILKYLNNEG